MNKHRKYSLSFSLIAVFPLISLFISLSGCATNSIASGGQQRVTSTTIITHVAPPMRPRHGYRHRHLNHDLFFDVSIGAYIVINMPGVYFHNGHFLRFYNNGWQLTTHLSPLAHRWQPAHHDHVSHGLHQLQHHGNHNPVDHTPINHGDRRHHQGHELIYNSAIGVYLVINQTDIYFHNNRYFRHHRGAWQSAKHLNNTWQAARHKNLPHKLRNSQYKKKHSRKEKHNKHGKKH